MRVLHAYNRHRGRGGSDVAVETTIGTSRENGLEVRAFVRDSRDLPRGLAGRLQALTGGLYARGNVKAFEREVREFEPDVVHVHELYPLISPWILPRCTALGVPVVMSVSDFRLTCPVTTHFSHGELCLRCLDGREHWAVLRNCRGSVPESAAYAAFGLVRRWFGLYERHVDRFIAPTDFLGRWLVEHARVPADRVVTVYPPVPIPETAADPAEGTYVAYAGRFAPGKGIDVLLAAGRECGLPIRLSGDKDHVEGILPGDDARVVPARNRTEVAAFLRGARILVVPSVWLETFGLVAAEAMSHGVPVVASRIGGLIENVEDGVSGLLFDPGDHRELARLLTRLWNDPELCRRLGRAGRQRTERHFRAERHFSGLLAVYEELAGARRSGAAAPAAGTAEQGRAGETSGGYTA